eukprot:CAMPEP_0185020962 /NCGR_PEP_ID=MMETSP1103-20130426/3610_1 /TAXON_ID=36769 /ORGANISM="Paraphysomonas bandaiensis, Strain Caron Lab Isolate" /LENGTH=853 /DNA_ID=CAMNT_0027552195 /DNA_START=129 /DNA_END=2690 /DNA_ORIENTATION=+
MSLPVIISDNVYFPHSYSSIPLSEDSVSDIAPIGEANAHHPLLVIATRVPMEISSELETINAGNNMLVSKIAVVARLMRAIDKSSGDTPRSVTVQICWRCSIVEFQPDAAEKRACLITTKHSVDPSAMSASLSLMYSTLKVLAQKLLSVLPPSRVMLLAAYMQDGPISPALLTDVMASICSKSKLLQKLKVLQAKTVEERMELVLELIRNELHERTLPSSHSSPLQLLIVGKNGIPNPSNRFHRLSDGSIDNDDELGEFRRKLVNPFLPNRVRDICEKHVKRLERLSQTSPDYGVLTSHLEALLDMPWGQESANQTPTSYAVVLEEAKKSLDADHTGMAEVKKRILEFVAVQSLQARNKKNFDSPSLDRSVDSTVHSIVTPTILCLVGPPGVGKTSLGQSIAAALRRKYEKVALGGVSNEAVLRGHRRTYVGAIPGRIAQAIRRAGCMDPVILLDEIDKLGVSGSGGDPAAALLEILDPAQNSSFTDHYLGVPLDLSKVVFIATANRADLISGPLLDRMEVLTLHGYTQREKLIIAQQHLIPRQTNGACLKLGVDLQVLPSAVAELVSGYTREAGVRQLTSRIASLCRSVAVKKASGEENLFPVVVTPEYVEETLGPRKFHTEEALQTPPAGVATGMAWTSAGGELLFIESCCYVSPFSGGTVGDITVTGSLGSVMRESCHIALSWVRNHTELILSRARENKMLETSDITHYLQGVEKKIFSSAVHVHVPDGAVLKDGPSAGCAIVTSLVSMVTDIPVDPLTAVTGEVTLRGAVLPVGGVKEKILSAIRGGIKQVLIPWRNMTDIKNQSSDDIFENIKVVPVTRIEDVLQHALFTTSTDMEAVQIESHIRSRL